MRIEELKTISELTPIPSRYLTGAGVSVGGGCFLDGNGAPGKLMFPSFSSMVEEQEFDIFISGDISGSDATTIVGVGISVFGSSTLQPIDPSTSQLSIALPGVLYGSFFFDVKCRWIPAASSNVDVTTGSVVGNGVFSSNAVPGGVTLPIIFSVPNLTVGIGIANSPLFFQVGSQFNSTTTFPTTTVSGGFMKLTIQD